MGMRFKEFRGNFIMTLTCDCDTCKNGQAKQEHFTAPTVEACLQMAIKKQEWSAHSFGLDYTTGCLQSSTARYYPEHHLFGYNKTEPVPLERQMEDEYQNTGGR